MQRKRLVENIIHGFFLLMGLVTVGCVLLITVYLIIAGIPAIREIGLVDFLFGPVWDSAAAEPKFGILPFILTSVYGTAGAILLGVPVGFMTAVFLAKMASPKLRAVVSSAVVLGVGRAIGEAMAVIMVSGNRPNMPSLFQSVRFLTTAVASEMSYAAAGLRRQALFSIALVLFLFIMLINAALNFFLKRSKER